MPFQHEQTLRSTPAVMPLARRVEGRRRNVGDAQLLETVIVPFGG